MLGLAVPVALLLIGVAAPPAITAVPTGERTWRLTITVAGEDVEAAQAQLLPRAVAVCRGLAPVPGKFSYTATKAVDGAVPASMTLVQEIGCGTTAPISRPVDRAIVAPAADPAAAGLIFAQRYLDARERGDGAAITALVDADAMNLPGILAGLAAERTTLGDPVAPRKVKVTVYRDPPDAPGPGIYIAVDYVMAYRNAPSVCGYVIVREPPGEAMRITREERATIDAKTAATMAPDTLAALREEFRCNVP